MNLIRCLALLLALCPLASRGQTLTVAPEKAKPGQAIVATLKDVPDLPAGAVEEQSSLTVENGEAKACNATTFHVWAKPGKSTVAWKRTAHIPEQIEVYFSPGPNFDPQSPEWWKGLVRKERTIPAMAIEQSAVATVEVEGAPEPKPDPPPPDPDVKPGKRQLVVIRESSTIDTATANILTSFRVGEPAKWLKDRGHTLTYFDPDDLPASLKAKLGQLPPLPAFFVIDATTGAVVSAQTLPLDVEKTKALVVKGGG